LSRREDVILLKRIARATRKTARQRDAGSRLCDELKRFEAIEPTRKPEYWSSNNCNFTIHPGAIRIEQAFGVAHLEKGLAAPSMTFKRGAAATAAVAVDGEISNLARLENFASRQVCRLLGSFPIPRTQPSAPARDFFSRCRLKVGTKKFSSNVHSRRRRRRRKRSKVSASLRLPLCLSKKKKRSSLVESAVDMGTRIDNAKSRSEERRDLGKQNIA
jgi:hypothetical protein